MGLEIRLGELPIIVPDTALNAMTSGLERKVRAMLAAAIPTDPIMRQAVKVLAGLAVPRVRDWMQKNAPDYPAPNPPRHADLVAYLSDYLTGYALYALGQMRAEICAQPWEVSVVEAGTGLQVAGFAALPASDPRADHAAGDGAGSGDAASVAGAPAPAA
ncbi:MAG: hypothetical protein ACXWPI_15875 [Ktedonobacterales bacterium]